MIEPRLYDVVELLYPVEKASLPAGAQGTLVHQHTEDVFEVEGVGFRPVPLSTPGTAGSIFTIVRGVASQGSEKI
jgi:hypothetical protein